MQEFLDMGGVARTLERTTALRWRKKKVTQLHPMTGDAIGVSYTPVLEQGWFCSETGETEWREIPVSDG